MEKTNFRYLEPEDLPEKVDFASGDVSFISLRLMFPPAAKLLKPDSHMICLVKPQFEAGKDKVGKKGVVRDGAVHREVLADFIAYSREAGFGLRGLDYSPIRGPEGNIEYLAWIEKDGESIAPPDLEALVETSHDAHGKDGRV